MVKPRSANAVRNKMNESAGSHSIKKTQESLNELKMLVYIQVTYEGYRGFTKIGS